MDLTQKVKNSKLNQNQKKFVLYDKDKNIMGVAGPGSGKTFTLAWRYGFRRKLYGDKVLAVTFDKSAEKSLKDQINEIWGNSQDIRKNVRTFHSIGKEIVENNLSEIGYEEKPDVVSSDHERSEGEIISIAYEKMLLDNPEIQNNIETKTIRKTDGKKIGYIFSDFINEGYLEGQINRKRLKGTISSNDFSPSLENVLEKHIEKLFEKYQEILIENNELTYSMMLYFGNVIIEERGSGALGFYDELIVDEVQDMNPTQYKLINNIDVSRLILLGDIYQSIYKFRNADPSIIYDFKDEKDPEIINLPVNYRSEENLVEFTNKIRMDMAKSNNIKTKPMVADQSTDMSEIDPTVISQDNIIDEINRLERAYDLNEIAVIGRTKRGSSQITKKLLKNGKLAYDYSNYHGLENSKEVKNIKKLVSISEEDSQKQVYEMIETFVDGIGGVTRENLEEQIDEEFDTTIFNFEELDQDELYGIGDDKYNSIRHFVLAVNDIRETENDNSKLNKIISLIEDIVNDPEEVYFDIIRKRFEEFGQLTNFDQEIERVSEKAKEKGISVINVHKVKGQEFKVVLANDVDFGYYIGKEEFYVATTRASERLIFMTDEGEKSNLLEQYLGDKNDEIHMESI